MLKKKSPPGDYSGRLPYYFPSVYVFEFNLEKGKPCRITACMLKIAALVLLKLFNNGNERCHTTDAF